MVIDAKLPPEDPAPLSIPPPAYAPSSEDSQEPSRNTQHQFQHYPPSNPGSPTLLPQWHTPGPGPQSIPPDEWAGQQYRNQPLCARGDHDVTTGFGLCGIICAILLFPIGLIFLCIDTEKKCARCGVRLN
ncbi:hypothetical protein B0F90DRAFT_1623531 [Multifurca ochricompacta]|uniref:Brain protein I3 n=1 Tax=Multifurca ochricompacta TaxID=376703 RepID=A0AAD4MAB3_9AGAM|nr:hypothetical protein B0F90DRAFT_1623531 [Multifurca ochricompacta]